MKTNKKSVSTFKTAAPAARVAGGAGAVADKISAEQTLRRCVLTNLLWEDNAYESGSTIVNKIREVLPKVPADRVAAIAIEARNEQKLRHVPLLIAGEMTRYDTHKGLVANVLSEIIQRPDELTEFLSLYWNVSVEKKNKHFKGKGGPLAAQAKKGLASAFTKFDAYQLGKYNQLDKEITLRDVLFMVSPTPKDQSQALSWKQLVDGTLPVPDTWETELSASKDKKASWTRLLKEKRLGALAFIRNLRNLTQEGVDKNLVRGYFSQVNPERVLPFNFLAAVRHAPEYTAQLETLMLKCLAAFPKLPGKTVFVVDVSGSMGAGISGKSEMTRLDAAAALTALMREVCEEPVIYATAGSDSLRKHQTAEVPGARGFALMENIKQAANKLGGGGIFLVQATKHIEKIEKDAARLIVLSDSQDCDYVKDPNSAAAFGTHNYLFDVAAHTKGVAYKTFLHIDGWSENVINFIYAHEQSLQQGW